MLDAWTRAERYRDLAEECRRLTAISSSTQMRNRYSRMAEHYSLLAAVEQFVRSVLVAAVILGAVTSGLALAQTTTPPSSTSSQVDDVSKWTSKQWNRAKAKWAEEKEKWADCQKQSADQNLTGRKSWSFLASCMMPASTSSKIDDVSQWTLKQWNRAKAKWEKETEKWADCQKQSKDQNLSGRKSWSFLASCMTS
jgi:hypothetical protein